MTVTHACPEDGAFLTSCCGKTPFELPREDRMTLDPALVTCKGDETMALGGSPVYPGTLSFPVPDSPALTEVIQRIQALEERVAALEKYVRDLFRSQCNEASERLKQIT